MDDQEIRDELDIIYSELSKSKKRKKYKKSIKEVLKLKKFLKRNLKDTILIFVIFSIILVAVLRLHMEEFNAVLLPALFLFAIINGSIRMKKNAINLIKKYKANKSNLELLYKASKTPEKLSYKLFSLALVLYVIPLFFALNVFSGNQAFKAQSIYLVKKFFINPKIGDWVSYTVPKATNKECSERMSSIGRINDIRDGKFHITKESYSDCDSSFFGYFNADINSIILPQYNITFLYPWLSYLNKLKGIKTIEYVRLELPESLKKEILYFRVEAHYFNMENKFVGLRNYYVKRQIFPDKNKINHEVLLFFTPQSGMMYDLNVTKKDKIFYDVVFMNKRRKVPRIKGSLFFSGSDWNSPKWSYDVTLESKIHVRGVTIYNQKTKKLQSYKYHFNKENKRVAEIREIYNVISEEEYLNAKYKSQNRSKKNAHRGYLFF